MDDSFSRLEKRRIRTEYGSVTLYLCSAGRAHFLFLPRHGATHSVPPHLVNFRANLRALSMSGVDTVIATSAVGSISKKLRVGELGLLDQFIDFSKRHLTYFDSKPVHADMTHPYDRRLRELIIDSAAHLRLKLTPGLVYVSVDGPRYETAAEIKMFGLLGGDVVGMTNAPEAILANELGMRYASVVVATNWAAGMQEAVSHTEVERVMSRCAQQVEELLVYCVQHANRT